MLVVIVNASMTVMRFSVRAPRCLLRACLMMWMRILMHSTGVPEPSDEVSAATVWGAIALVMLLVCWMMWVIMVMRLTVLAPMFLATFRRSVSAVVAVMSMLVMLDVGVAVGSRFKAQPSN